MTSLSGYSIALQSPTGTEALCKKLGRKAIVMVGSNTAIGGTVRCVTLAAKDDLAVQQWNKSLEKVSNLLLS